MDSSGWVSNCFIIVELWIKFCESFWVEIKSKSVLEHPGVKPWTQGQKLLWLHWPYKADHKTVSLTTYSSLVHSAHRAHVRLRKEFGKKYVGLISRIPDRILPWLLRTEVAQYSRVVIRLIHENIPQNLNLEFPRFAVLESDNFHPNYYCLHLVSGYTVPLNARADPEK